MNEELTPRHVHFVGIGGIGMSALARYLLQSGTTVSGSDLSPGPQVSALEQLGARVYIGHEAEHVDGAQLVVITAAADASNPEIQAARKRDIPVIKRAELLAKLFNQRFGVAVAGTHGKTTTSALLGWMLTVGRQDPTILIGGIDRNLGSNARAGESQIVVAEADEYDASFLHLHPRIAVITNVEPEHLDFYGTEERLYEAFRQFAGSASDALVIPASDSILSRMPRRHGRRITTFGLGDGDWRIESIEQNGEKTRFSVSHAGQQHQFRMALPGQHNVLNATAAMAAADLMGIGETDFRRALETFAGVERRLEEKGKASNVITVDDYSHHPTEIRAALAALKARYKRPIRLIFQPHTYSRTKALLEDFAGCFAQADAVYLLDIYAARETDPLGISGSTLAEAVSRQHPAAKYVDTQEAALRTLLKEVQPGDLVVTMGAGDVYELDEPLLKELGHPNV